MSSSKNAAVGWYNSLGRTNTIEVHAREGDTEGQRKGEERRREKKRYGVEIRSG